MLIRGLMLFIELFHLAFRKPLFAKVGEELDGGAVLARWGKEIDFCYEHVVDRLLELDLIYTPNRAIGDDRPLDALVCAIVDDLADVDVFQFDTNGFGLNEEVDFLADPDSEVDIRALDGKLSRDFLVFLLP